MIRRRWLGGLVVGVSLGATACGGDSSSDAGYVDLGGPIDTGTVDAGTADTGRTDTGAVDTGVDAGTADTGAVDAGTQDAGTPDTGAADTGVTDIGTPDVGTPDAGTPDAGTPDAGPPATARTTPTNGSAVVLTRDDAIIVATNRTANSISVFTAQLNGTGASTAPTATRSTVIPTANAEPWAAVIGADDNTAYVILRRTQELVRVSSLRSVPSITARVNVGSEPTGLAISPTGAHVYVANWADGTVSDVNVSGDAMTVARTINLNASLAGTGALGPSVTAATARPGLAHPRAIVVTNNGNASDADETVYVTEFFAQQADASITQPSDSSRLDVDHRGLVYRFNAGTGVAAAPITLARFLPASVGFGAAGCFPNQLYAAAIKGERLYVTSVCESPAGPVDPQQNLYAALYVVNTTSNEPEPANHLLLTRRFQDRYDGATPAVADTNARRFPLVPNDIGFTVNGNVAYITSYGSDAVFRVGYASDGSFVQVGNGNGSHFIDLAATPSAPGRMPIGIALSNTALSRAVVLNENSRNLSLVDLSVQASAAGVASADAPVADSAEDHANIGRRFFVTGLARWSRNGQGWGSCEGCHPDGLTDNVTWAFATGPRQTISLDGTFDRAGTNQRILNWGAIFDEVHDFEGNTRGTSGGVGAIVATNSAPPVVGDRIINDGTTVTPPQVATVTPQAGLNGATQSLMPASTTAPPHSLLPDWDNINAYVRGIRPPRAATGVSTDDVTAGRALFVSNNCAGCHGSPAGSNAWTISRRFYDPSEAHNNPTLGTLRSQTYAGFPSAFAALNPPSNGHTAPFRLAAADATTLGNADQISCVLRAVGTIAGTVAAPTAVAPTGVTVFELRANGAVAQGGTGFNVPSLVGMVTGAPYFHAGNARTLEEALSTTFQAHHQAFGANFLDASDPMRDAHVRQLVAFLLSIDDDATPIAVPAIPSITRVDLCAGFTP